MDHFNCILKILFNGMVSSRCNHNKLTIVGNVLEIVIKVKNDYNMLLCKIKNKCRSFFQ